MINRKGTSASKSSKSKSPKILPFESKPAARSSNGSLYSMTGYACVDSLIGEDRFRFEMRSVNHRFLDIKIRLPKEHSALEPLLRKLIQNKFGRGSIEARLEKWIDSGKASGEYQLNFSTAADYFEQLVQLQKTLGLPTSEIQLKDLLAFPDVISRKSSEISISLPPEKIWEQLEPLALDACEGLLENRSLEGQKTQGILEEGARELQSKIQTLRNHRTKSLNAFNKQISEKVKKVFEAHPVSGKEVKQVLEGRISQELALLVEKTDYEEELHRFKGHVEQFIDVLQQREAAGRKLDFILQEMQREINTLSNKAQDLAANHEAVSIKVLIEQLREQVMNIE